MGKGNEMKTWNNLSVFILIGLLLGASALTTFAGNGNGNGNGGGNACNANPDGGGYDCPDGNPGQGDQHDNNNGNGNDPDGCDDNNGRKKQCQTPEPTQGTPVPSGTPNNTPEASATPSATPNATEEVETVVPTETVVVTLPPVIDGTPYVPGQEVETDQGTGTVQDDGTVVIVIATEAPIIQEGEAYRNCFNEDLLAVTNSEQLNQQRGLVFNTANGVPNWDSMTIIAIENADLLQANTGTNECHAVGSAVFEDGETKDMVVFNRAGEIIFHKVTNDLSEVSVTCSQETALCAFLDAENNNQLYVTDASRSFNWDFEVFGADRVEAYGEILMVTIRGYTYQYSFQGELISHMPEIGTTVATTEEGRYFIGSPLQFEANGEEFVTMGLGQTANDIAVWDSQTGVVLFNGNLGYSEDIQQNVPFSSEFDSRLVDLVSPTYFK